VRSASLLVWLTPLIAAAQPPSAGLVVVDGLVVGEIVRHGASPLWRAPQAARLRPLARRELSYVEVGVGEVKQPALCLKGLRHMPELHRAAFDLEAARPCRTTPPVQPAGKVLVASRVTVPRTVKRVALGPLSAEVQGFLRQIGHRVKPRVLQAFQVDLDGDGPEEVVIAAAQTGSEPHFSAVLVRSGKRTRPIVWSTDKEDRRAGARAPETLTMTYRIAALADLDGDGLFEIVVEQDYQEGGGGVVARFRSGTLEVLVSYVAGS
jgi:hypothetical protein